MPDSSALHLGLASVAFGIGVVGAVVAAWTSNDVGRIAARPVAAALGAEAVVLATTRAPFAPFLVAVAALLGAATASWTTRRRASIGTVDAPATGLTWLALATAAWFAFWSLPDTEGAVVAASLAVPVVLVALVRAQPTRVEAIGADAGAAVVLLGLVLVVDDASLATWGRWWLPKALGVLVALGIAVALVRTSERARRRPPRSAGRPG